MSIAKAFNNHFIEFLNDVSTVFPDDKNIKASKFYSKNVISMNPSLIIKAWFTYCVKPYESEIEKGDFSFFMDKDYGGDINYNKSKSESIITAIDSIKEKAQQMSEENKKKLIKYLQNLSKLSKMYKN
jgi:glutamyl/glutaminyl-tRNA synthetase